MTVVGTEKGIVFYDSMSALTELLDLTLTNVIRQFYKCTIFLFIICICEKNLIYTFAVCKRIQIHVILSTRKSLTHMDYL